MSIHDGSDGTADLWTPVFTAGESISAGDAVALDLSDGKVYKASAASWAYRINLIGFAITAAGASSPIEVNTSQIVAEKTGLTPGSAYYLSDTQGAISTSAGTIQRKIGIATSATRILRPKNGAPVSDWISRALSSDTPYAHMEALNSGHGSSPSHYTFIINGITIVDHARSEVSTQFAILAPDDTVTMTADTSNGGIGAPIVRILDR